MKKTVRRIITILLAVAMLTSTCLSVFATDYDEPVEVVNGEIQGVEVEVIGSVTVDNKGYNDPALEVRNYDDAGTPAEDTSLEVTGDVEITRADYNATAVEVENSTDATLSLTIDGKVSATTENEYSEATGIDSVNKGGDIIVEVKQDVVADDVGIDASSTQETVYTPITTLDDILPYQEKVQLDPDYSSDDGSQRYIYTDESTGTKLSYVLDADGSIRYGNLTTINFNQGSTDITVAGNVSGDVKVSAGVANNNVSVNVGKDLTGKVSASSVEDSISTVNIVGNVNNEKNEYSLSGVAAETENGKVSVEIGGSASVVNTNENYGWATGIVASTIGDESDLLVSVGGNVTAETKNQSEYSDYSSTGISSTNMGGKQIIDVGGNVEAENYGISASSSVHRTYMTFNDFNELKDHSVQDETYQSPDGWKRYNYQDDNGVTATYLVDDQGQFKEGNKYTQYTGSTGITVRGTVTGDVKASAGVANNNVTVDVKKDVNGEVRATSIEDSLAKVIVGEDVNNIDNSNSWESIYGILAETTNGTAIVDVKGNAEVKNTNTERGGATGIYAKTTGEDSSLQVTVGGDLSALSTRENDTTTGISSMNKGGTVVIDVTGDVTAEGAGIFAESAKTDTNTYLYKEEDIAEYKDKAELYYTYDSGMKEYKYEDKENGIIVYYYINADDTFNHGEKTTTHAYKGSTKITVSGEVTGYVSASANVAGNNIQIDVAKGVDGSVSATAGENAKANITVGGNAEGSVYASSGKNASSTLTVGGDVSYENKGNNSAYAISASATDGKTQVDISGDASVKNSSENRYETTGLKASTDGENSDLTVHIGGDLTAATGAASSESNKSKGITSTNKGGKIDITVGGDVNAEGTGISAQSEKSSTRTPLNKMEDIADIKDKAELKSTDASGRKYYVYQDEANGISAYYYINSDGTFDYGNKTTTEAYKGSTDITVAGSVTGSVSGSAKVAENNVNIDIKKDVEGTVSATSAEDAKATIAIGGSVNYEYESEQEYYSSINMVKAAASDGTTTVSIAGDVTGSVKGENITVNGISAETTGEDSDLDIRIGGKLAVESEDEEEKSNGILSTNRGGKIDITVNGDVAAQGTGISAQSSKSSTSTSLNKMEDIAEFKDKAELVHTYESGRKEYSYQDEENGISVYYYINADGTFDYGNKTTTKAYKGSTDITVAGGVTGNVSASANVAENNIQIDITKDVDGNVSAASGENAKATVTVGGDADGNASARANGEKSESTVTVAGDSKGAGASAAGEDAKAVTEIGGDAEGSVTASSGKSASATVTVGGSVNYEYESEGDYSTTINGVNASASDGTTKINIAKDVTVQNKSEKGTAIGITAETAGEDSDLDIQVGGNVASYSATTEERERGKGISTTNKGGTLNVTVAGDVLTDGDGITAGAARTSEQQTLTEDDIAEIKDKARFDYNYDDGRKAYYYSDENGNTYHFTLNADGTFNGGYADIYTENAGETTIDVGGSVSVERKQETNRSFYGISASANLESQKTTVNVGKDVVVSGNGGIGAYLQNRAGETDINIGGEVQSGGTGINLEDRSSIRYRTLTTDEIETLNFEPWDSYDEEDEDGTVHQYRSYRYEDEDGNTYYYSTYDDVLNYSEAAIRQDKKATNTINIKGGVTATAEDEFDVSGVRISQDNRLGTDEVNIGGDVTVTGNGKAWATGVSTEGYNGTANLEIEGQIAVTSAEGGVGGLNASAYGGEQDITIKGGVSVEGKSIRQYEDEDGNTYTDEENIYGIAASAYGPDGKLNVTVLDDVSAYSLDNPDEVTAVQVYNSSEDHILGSLNMKIEGDVTSNGKGLYVDSGDRGREYLEGTATINESEFYTTRKWVDDNNEIKETKIYYNQAGDYYYDENGEMWREIPQEAGGTTVKILGDVHGDQVGIELSDTDNTAVLVDGTVSGGDSAILVDRVINDSLVLTVWEIKPDDEGNYIEQKIGTDEEGNPITAEDEKLLQEVQYIIRVEPTQAGMINLEGTTEYEGYQVAHEGDTVTLKLNIPKGYTVDGAFGDLGQQFQLLKDASGNYYLVVPRGGAVLLSLKMHKTASQTVKIKYDPNGGVVDGHDSLYSLSTYKNKELTLPTPDEREGYEFVGWYKAEYGRDSEKWTDPSEGDANILQPGTTFKADKNYTCTAIWKTK